MLTRWLALAGDWLLPSDPPALRAEQFRRKCAGAPQRAYGLRTTPGC